MEKESSSQQKQLSTFISILLDNKDKKSAECQSAL